MYKVLLAEDEEFILQGLTKIINWDELDLKVIHKANDGVEALKLWEQEEADIVITDISMPEMDGLTLLEELRKRNERTRFIILSGYDEFEYARRAIPLDVENYILKPIDEDLLKKALEATIIKLNEMDQKKIEPMDDFLLVDRLLKKQLSQEEFEYCIRELNIASDKPYYVFAILKFKSESLKEDELNKIYHFTLTDWKKDVIRILFTEKDELLIICSWDIDSTLSPCDYFITLQNELEYKYNVLTFIAVGPVISNLKELGDSYRKSKRIHKYIIIEGYGSCIDETYITNRKNLDIDFNENLLYNLIVKRDKESAIGYIEDLFINNLKSENISIDVIYKMAVELFMMIQKIREEFIIDNVKYKNNISEMLDELNRADDIAVIKRMFILEVSEIVDALHTESSQYSPVVKQILTKVENDYSEDMSLKTLAQKYNMNVAYLGQIFLKEVGCSFSYYLNNERCKRGRDLILNTNMRINDIANEIGYVDISYFYRKFRSFFGVSPASLREMKNY